ncbi:metal ABC transporter permease [Paenibacillus sp.]|uniref:metal ABC transporter permease n=1 Tax=Paenibacillus sp. TaxID=58172 RepID=UPI002D2A4C00|nr:metal ABC transporter permease [Paenibacillus sp.]HZG85098.1 metal ABC transporter permease [Paenibacillus sp.]
MWDIFTFPFFQRALIGGLLIGGMAPLLGVFLVLRRLSMIGDTIAHVSIAGVALGFLINVYPVGVGLVFALLAAFAIERLRSAYRTYAELSIAIIMSGGVALATFLFTVGAGFNMNVTSFFFGSIYSLNMVDLYTIAAVTVIVWSVVATYAKEYFLLTFDEDAASVSGLPVRMLNLLLTVLTALVISVAIKIVGALLVSSLLTIPVACSLLAGKSFKQTIIWAVVFSETAVLLGLLGAGWFNLAPGASIVLLLIVMLIGLLTVRKGFRL